MPGENFLKIFHKKTDYSSDKTQSKLQHCRDP